MYNKNFSSFGSTTYGNAQHSTGTQSYNNQFTGSQRQYQPVGIVQSYYGQNTASQTTQNYRTQPVQQHMQQQNVSPESFHMANYRGYQNQNQNQNISPSFGTSTTSSYGMNNYNTNQTQTQTGGYASQQQQFSPYGSSAQSGVYNQTIVSPNAFHTANYKGNMNQNFDFGTTSRTSGQTQSGYIIPNTPTHQTMSANAFNQNTSYGYNSF
ncbi:hypothetical protein [Paenibacillus aestuarii]|uniref:Spore coat protein n=1 Tax=Paenibacillus aestuarii TaxID=516965 RepID=A0ABW0KJB1_9BACL|nr:hypothetical protein [Paenibacillus aestuarii]